MAKRKEIHSSTLFATLKPHLTTIAYLNQNIRYLGVICDTSYGYGISSGLSGGFVDINSEVVWDLSVIMHEIGHQFGSDHTHDSDGYSPVVDTCGTSCPAGLPLDHSTTLMSYCDFCE